MTADKIQKDPQEFTRGHIPRDIAASHNQVSLWWIDYCSLTPNCVTVLKLDGTEAATMSLNIWETFPSDVHIIDWDDCEQRFGGLPLHRGRVVRAEACLSRVQHFAVVGCLHARFQSLAHTPLPFCLLQLCAPTKTHTTLSQWGLPSILNRHNYTNYQGIIRQNVHYIFYTHYLYITMRLFLSFLTLSNSKLFCSYNWTNKELNIITPKWITIWISIPWAHFRATT